MAIVTSADDPLSLEVHVWLAAVPEETLTPERTAAYLALLDEDERHRHERFRFDRDKILFLVAHALLRTTLSRYAAVDPAAWRFRTSTAGRPEIDTGSGAPALAFSLTHTHGLTACLVGRGLEVGVDAERPRASADLSGVAARVFTLDERATLAALPADGPAWLDRFFALWTLKEAYVKARGLGLSLPLDRISFSLEADRIAVRLDSVLEDRAGAWQFALFRPTSEHTLAVALRPGENSTHRRIVVRRCVPLGSDSDDPAPGLRAIAATQSSSSGLHDSSLK